MSVTDREYVECDGSAECQSAEHIEGCFATMHRRKDVPRLPLIEENQRLRSQLAGAVQRAEKAEAELASVYDEGFTAGRAQGYTEGQRDNDARYHGGQ